MNSLQVNSKPYTLTADTSTGDLTKLCNHKRKLLAMSSIGGGGTPPTTPQPVGMVPVPVPTTPKLAPATNNGALVDPSKLRKGRAVYFFNLIILYFIKNIIYALFTLKKC